MRAPSRTVALSALLIGALAISACQSNGGRLTPTGTGRTPSSGAVPGQTPG